MIRMLDLLIKFIRSAAVYNPDVQVAPACILWLRCVLAGKIFIENETPTKDEVKEKRLTIV